MGKYYWDVLHMLGLRSDHHRLDAIFPECFRHLHKDYTVDSKILGQGSFGTVRRVQLKSDDKTGTYYACKTILKCQVDDNEILKQEVLNLNRCCQHPNIIQLLDVIEDQRAIHLVMESCTGGELYSKVLLTGRNQSGKQQQRCGFDEATSVHIIHQILSAIAYCHEVGHVCHRDLKASNFLFMHPDLPLDVRVIDFGLSKYVPPSSTAVSPQGAEKSATVDGEDKAIGTAGIKQGATGSSTCASSPSQTLATDKHDETFKQVPSNCGAGFMTSEVGTPYYVAPEVLTQETYTNKCDIWSIGVISYLCLTGQLPVQGKDERDTVKMLMDPELKVDFTSDIWHDGGPLSSFARDFCKALLQRDPNNRPTAKEALLMDWMVKNYGDPPAFPTPLNNGSDPPLPRLSQDRKERRLRKSR